MFFDGISSIGQSIIDVTTVMVKGAGILLLQASQVSAIDEYNKISEHSFTLMHNQVYAFKQDENGVVSCDKVEGQYKSIRKKLIIPKGVLYQIDNIDYYGQFDKTNKNSMGEEITIKAADDDSTTIKFRLDANDFGLSVKERIDLLENCYKHI